MIGVLTEIDLKVEELRRSSFCCHFLDEETTHSDIFAFVPSQAFLVMGFQDILDSIKFSDSESKIEMVLRQHCLEDANHWKWYLKDLETLEPTLKIGRGSFQKNLMRLWSPENKATRYLVYDSISFIRQSKSPEIDLVVIEVLEAAFSVFISTIRSAYQKKGYYERLDYYGKSHTEKEEGHSLWESESGLAIESVRFDLSQRKTAILIVDTLFGHFFKIFEEWNNLRLNGDPRSIIFKNDSKSSPGRANLEI